MIVLAHRGLRSHGPENTIAAMQGVAAASARGISIGVELDVRRTADDLLVAVHDDYVTPDPAKPKSRFMWNENWYESARRILGETCPPRFEAMLEAIGDSVEMIDIDSKERGIVEPVLAAIRHLPAEIVSISAHIPEVIQEVRKCAPAEIRVGMSTTEFFHLGVEGLSDLIERVEADFLFADDQLVTSHLVDRLHHAGKAIGVYTVNDPIRMDELRSMHIDYLCTDIPELAIPELAGTP